MTSFHHDHRLRLLAANGCLYASDLSAPLQQNVRDALVLVTEMCSTLLPSLNTKVSVPTRAPLELLIIQGTRICPRPRPAERYTLRLIPPADLEAKNGHLTCQGVNHRRGGRSFPMPVLMIFGGDITWVYTPLRGVVIVLRFSPSTQPLCAAPVLATSCCLCLDLDFGLSGYSLPGLNRLCGSSVRLIVFMSSTVPSPSSSNRYSRFPMPTPCSPVPTCGKEEVVRHRKLTI